MPCTASVATGNKEIKCWLLELQQKELGRPSIYCRQFRHPRSTYPVGRSRRHYSKSCTKEALPILEQYQSMLYARGYAQNTITAYVHLMAPLIAELHPTLPDSYTLAQINTYRATRLFRKSNSTQRQFVGALETPAGPLQQQQSLPQPLCVRESHYSPTPKDHRRQPSSDR